MSVELSIRLASVVLVSFTAVVLVVGAVKRRIMWQQLSRAAEHPEPVSPAHPLHESGLLVPTGGSCRFDWGLASGSVEFEPRHETVPAAARHARWSRLCHPDDLPLLQVALGEHLAGRVARVSCEIRIRDAAGAWLWVLLQGQLTDREPHDEGEHVLGALIDIDGLKRSLQILSGQSRVMASGGVLAFSFAARPPHELVAVSAQSPIVVQASPAESEQIRWALADLIHGEDIAMAQACIEQALLQPGTAAQAELRRAGGANGGVESLASFRALVADGSDQSLMHGCLIPIDDQKRAEALAAERLAQLQRVVLKTGETQRFLEGLQHMTELLQLAENEADGHEVISQAGRHLFPGWQGAVTVDDSYRGMAVLSRWGGGVEIDSTLARGALGDCWAVRRGRLHHVASHGGTRSIPACSHFGYGNALPPGVAHTVCVPFTAPPDKPGALHLIVRDPVEEDELYATFWRAETLVETLELSLANLHLRVTLREQADRDGMTGLFNRRYFDDVLQREISRARRGGERLTLALMDIDRFKLFNDTFGHEAGDEVIRAVADQLLKFVRSYDVACRIGGEELALLMSDVSLSDACARLDRLREQIGTRTIQHKGLELPTITISIGVASLESGGSDDLLRRADLALYASKYGGRNRLSCWTPQLEAAPSSSESNPAKARVSEGFAE